MLWMTQTSCGTYVPDIVFHVYNTVINEMLDTTRFAKAQSRAPQRMECN